MPETSDPSPRAPSPGSVTDHPYRDSLAAGLAAALVAGAVVALVDALLASGRCSDCGGAGSLLPVVFGLYAVPALVVGVACGLVAGGFRATYGPGALGRAYRRLRADPEVDRQVAGGLLAAAVALAGFALFTALAALKLVAGVERQSVGAILLGCLLVAALPAFALLALPVFRVTRRLALAIPRLGPLPASLTLLLLAAAAALALVLGFIFTRLDWRALNLGIYLVLAGFAAVMAAWTAIWYGPLDATRRRLRWRGYALLGALVVALLLPAVGLRGNPGPKTLLALTEHTTGARVLLTLGRALRDSDGDGYSAFLGGPDCDDSNPAVHPGAPEIPGNGIDDNCLGGDRAAVADRAPEPQPAATVAHPKFDGNVILLAIDTLRADRLGVAGYRRDDKSLTPRLDQFAEQSVYFTHVFAQAPNTPRSFPSIFTSRYPSQVDVDKQFKNYSDLEPDNLLVYEVLQQAGYLTTGFSSHFFFTEERGIRQGFTEYNNEGALDIAGSNHDTASPRIVPRVEERLAELAAHPEQKFVMFVHLFEPHSTYMKHDGFPITLHKIPGLVQKYDYEIAFVDQYVGRILDAIDKDGLADKTMVVIFSDHGEAFGVHRFAGQAMFFHGQTLYAELLRVPLLIRMPGVAPRKVDDPAMLLDVAPTVVDALGVDVPPAFEGRSLMPYLRGDPVKPRPAYAELLPAPSWNHAAKMVVSADGRYQLIYVISDKRWELYDLVDDPEERHDLAAKLPDKLHELQAALTDWIEVDLQR